MPVVYSGSVISAVLYRWCCTGGFYINSVIPVVFCKGDVIPVVFIPVTYADDCYTCGAIPATVIPVVLCR